MDTITLGDKKFKKYIDYETVRESIVTVARKINADMANEHIPLLVGVLNGSFMFLADLMKNLNFNCELTFVRVSSYEGTKSTGELCEVLGLNTNINERTVILVEDIVDTGNTITQLHRMLTENHNPKQIKIATLLLKPNVYNKPLALDYVAMEIPNDFIVGFGLDYNELGRNLKDIYKITE
ncbi:MAG: hypoxanthine phosphoribosyltransferase [Prevotellaceae bacterium]|jgi:hypoxanthine phosphoribosyltransferase|nr:hypoxanthine phosphoribosyltransferase [Prevotellaceae bacterium]